MSVADLVAFVQLCLSLALLLGPVSLALPEPVLVADVRHVLMNEMREIGAKSLLFVGCESTPITFFPELEKGTVHSTHHHEHTANRCRDMMHPGAV